MVKQTIFTVYDNIWHSGGKWLAIADHNYCRPLPIFVPLLHISERAMTSL